MADKRIVADAGPAPAPIPAVWPASRGLVPFIADGSPEEPAPVTAPAATEGSKRPERSGARREG